MARTDRPCEPNAAIDIGGMHATYTTRSSTGDAGAEISVIAANAAAADEGEVGLSALESLRSEGRSDSEAEGSVVEGSERSIKCGVSSAAVA